MNLARTAISDYVVAGGVANGGGDPGSWNANFHGTTTADGASTTDVDETVYLDSVVGEFNANFGNGSVAGALGARKQ